jgi:hypothetical protein
MARQLKELRGLMPWTWDSRLDTHPPGEAAMRDFEDCRWGVGNWTRGPRRASHVPATQAAPQRNKRSAKVPHWLS